jgi:hypothetical protein
MGATPTEFSRNGSTRTSISSVLLPEVERTGNPPVVPNGSVGYTHRPGDLAERYPRLAYNLMTSLVGRSSVGWDRYGISAL